MGFTGDQFDERIRKHNSIHKGFTGHTGDWKLVYQEEYKSKADAMAREKQKAYQKTHWFRTSRFIIGRVGGSTPSTPTKVYFLLFS